jgi:hypothetical protein
MSEGIDKGEDRKGLAKLLAGRISCIVGILFGAGGILFALRRPSCLAWSRCSSWPPPAQASSPASHPWVTGTISKARIGNLGCSPKKRNYLYACHELPRTS